MIRPKLIHLAVAGLLALCAGAQTHPLESLIDAARKGPSSPGLAEFIAKTLTTKGGTAVWGQDFLFVMASDDAVTVSIDGQPAVGMARIGGSNLWMRLEKMRTGVTHSYQYYAAGKPLGRARTSPATTRIPTPRPECRRASSARSTRL